MAAALAGLAVAALPVATVACGRPAGPAVAQVPAPLAIPDNASRVTARVLAHRVHPPGSITTPPAVRPGRTLHAYTLAVTAVAPARPDAPSYAEAGTVEAFSTEPLAPELVGREVTAILGLTGDERGTRWLIGEVQPR